MGGFIYTDQISDTEHFTSRTGCKRRMTFFAARWYVFCSPLVTSFAARWEAACSFCSPSARLFHPSADPVITSFAARWYVFCSPSACLLWARKQCFRP